MFKFKTPLLLIPVLLASQWLGFAAAHQHESPQNSGRPHIHVGTAHAGPQSAKAAHHHPHVNQHGHRHGGRHHDEHHSSKWGDASLGQSYGQSAPAEEHPSAAIYIDSGDYLAPSQVGFSLELHRGESTADLLIPSVPLRAAQGRNRHGGACAGFLDTPGCPLYLRTLSLRI